MKTGFVDFFSSHFEYFRLSRKYSYQTKITPQKVVLKVWFHLFGQKAGKPTSSCSKLEWRTFQERPSYQRYSVEVLGQNSGNLKEHKDWSALTAKYLDNSRDFWENILRIEETKMDLRGRYVFLYIWWNTSSHGIMSYVTLASSRQIIYSCINPILHF